MKHGLDLLIASSHEGEPPDMPTAHRELEAYLEFTPTIIARLNNILRTDDPIYSPAECPVSCFCGRKVNAQGRIFLVGLL
ncbi:hypothetical protein DTO027B5_3316 [Paecilomyces variotii]|nr:hypothetical protein DTO027B3_4013 [Paecilomyces variotii]KAJ9334810.1 hypothetical protein DTO027B5_3316 [Paecilomyces variotii]